MDAVAVLMVGAGVWVMYSAYKGHDPVTVALGILKSSTPAPSPNSKVPAGAGQAIGAAVPAG